MRRPASRVLPFLRFFRVDEGTKKQVPPGQVLEDSPEQVQHDQDQDDNYEDRDDGQETPSLPASIAAPSERPCWLHSLYPGDAIAETRASVEGRLS
jgi:hypothetical protein